MQQRRFFKVSVLFFLPSSPARAHSTAAVWRGKRKPVRVALDSATQPSLLLEAARAADHVRPVHIAASRGHHKVLSVLIERGVRVDSRHASGATALVLAAQAGAASCVALLLGAGADVNATSDNGMSALFAAAQGGHVECAQLLVDAGASVEAAARNGATPLFVAAQKGFVEVLRLLVVQGKADLQRCHPKTGSTPLDFAVAHGRTDAVLLLVALGARVADRAPSGDASTDDDTKEDAVAEKMQLLAATPAPTSTRRSLLSSDPTALRMPSSVAPVRRKSLFGASKADDPRCCDVQAWAERVERMERESAAKLAAMERKVQAAEATASLWRAAFVALQSKK